MNITINKASLKDELFLKGDYDLHINDANRNNKFDDSHPVHEDLKNIFMQLGPHLCRLCDQHDPDIDNIEQSVHCTGFTLGGNDSGITLTGYRMLSDDRILNLNSPFQKWESDGYDGYIYPYIDELSELIESAKGEIKAFLFDGKQAPVAKQLSIFDEDGDVKGDAVSDDAEIEGAIEGMKSEKPKRGRKKKLAEPDTTEDF